MMDSTFIVLNVAFVLFPVLVIIDKKPDFFSLFYNQSLVSLQLSAEILGHWQCPTSAKNSLKYGLAVALKIVGILVLDTQILMYLQLLQL